jgi:hypothetical protein
MEMFQQHLVLGRVIACSSTLSDFDDAVEESLDQS